MTFPTVLALACLLVPAPQGDLRSKDPLERLAAVAMVEAGERGAGAKTLVKLFDDPDWEVVEAAVARLAEIGAASDVDSAVALALDAPVRRVRHAAARAAARLDAPAAAEALLAKAKGKTALVALEALALVAPALEGALPGKALDKLVAGDDPDVREAAAAARVAAAGGERARVVAALLGAPHVMVQAAAARVAGERGAAAADAELVDALAQRLAADAALAPVVERRLLRAFVASAGALDGAARAGAAEAALGRLAAGGAPHVARGVRLVRALAAAGWLDLGVLREALVSASAHGDVGVRAEAAAALAVVKGESALARARELAKTDLEPRVRRAATQAAFALEGPETAPGLEFALHRLAREQDAPAREDVLVQLGRRDLAGALAPLTEALSSDDWRLRVAAAVSLGKTRLAEARAPLEALLAASQDDWRGRASAIAGLAQLYRTDAVPTLIAALADPEPMVRRIAHGWLLAATSETFPPEVEPWQAWWQARAGRVTLVDIVEADERQRRYGYAGVSPEAVYRGLDVLVLQSRGDHVEELLRHVGVPHRLCTAGQVRQAGPDPRGLFVANCTGEITGADAEALQFFLHAGGYVFGSCWALHETIGRIAPGPMRKLETRGDVLDDVRAYAATPGSAYLDGVFAEGSVPVYALEGAHLIDVLQPERVEVLVDSPEAAERWGSGDLAAWFRVGHGLVLDSVNHFDVQGLERAKGLRKAEERQAYAIDHMGYDYAAVRATRDDGRWASAAKAAKEMPDLSVFRLVTNFVRLRRLAGD